MPAWILPQRAPAGSVRLRRPLCRCMGAAALCGFPTAPVLRDRWCLLVLAAVAAAECGLALGRDRWLRRQYMAQQHEEQAMQLAAREAATASERKAAALSEG